MKNIIFILCCCALFAIAIIAGICVIAYEKPFGSSTQQIDTSKISRPQADQTSEPPQNIHLTNEETEKIWAEAELPLATEGRSIKNRTHPSGTPSAKATNNLSSRQQDLDAWIKELLSSGAIHSVNVEFNEVRIAPELWRLLSIESKQGFVYQFSKYFNSKGSTGRVTILSNRNDKKLATYGSWGGMKILE